VRQPGGGEGPALRLRRDRMPPGNILRRGDRIAPAIDALILQKGRAAVPSGSGELHPGGPHRTISGAWSSHQSPPITWTCSLLSLGCPSPCSRAPSAVPPWPPPPLTRLCLRPHWRPPALLICTAPAPASWSCTRPHHCPEPTQDCATTVELLDGLEIGCLIRRVALGFQTGRAKTSEEAAHIPRPILGQTLLGDNNGPPAPSKPGFSGSIPSQPHGRNSGPAG
jgi:hypothetical protein